MARQRIHNSRSGTGAGNAGASWISYSDMMAALLLVFVLILSVILYQYLTVLESTNTELDAQREQMAQQQIILLGQQEQLDTQTMQLAAQQVTMDNQSALIVIMQGEIEGKQAALDAQAAELELSQQELANAIVLMQAQQAELNSNRIALSAAQKALEDQKAAFALQTSQLGSMVGVKAEIISEVSSSLSRRGVTATVDPNTGDIMISSNQLTFQTNSAELTPESKAFLDRFVPVYLEVLMRPEYADYLGTIIIEGHTDMSGSYERNMELSQERALEVLLYIRNNVYYGDSRTQARLDTLLVAMGKGYSDPVYYTYNGQQYIDQDASRRVEFKFSLRDAEMIEEINRLLNGQ